MGNLGAQKEKRNDTPISAKKDIMGDKTVRVRADLHHIIKIETAKNGGNVKEVMDQALEEYIRNIYLTNFKRSENEMAVTYEKTFEIEIINELSASVYNRVLNYVLNHELNKNDSQLLEVNLLNQLKLAKRVNLFDYSLEELQAVHEYWRSMNRYSKQVLNKEKVA